MMETIIAALARELSKSPFAQTTLSVLAVIGLIFWGLYLGYRVFLEKCLNVGKKQSGPLGRISVWISFANTVLLLWAMLSPLPWPMLAYPLLRTIVAVSAGFIVVAEEKRVGWLSIPMIGVSAFFYPFFPGLGLSPSRATWALADLVGAILFGSAIVSELIWWWKEVRIATPERGSVGDGASSERQPLKILGVDVHLGEEILIRYSSPRTGSEDWRRIVILGLGAHRGKVSVVGKNPESGRIRTFALARVLEVKGSKKAS